MAKLLWRRGKPLRTTGTVQDITERKNAENLIGRSAVLHAVVASIAALINNPSLDEEAPKSLRMVGETLNVDRCVVVENVDRPGAPPNMVPTYQWNKSGLGPLLPAFVAELTKHPDVLSWLAPLNNGKPVITTRANANATVQSILSALKSTSILLIPIFVAGKNWGHIGLNDSTPDRQWTAAEIEPLLALATLFGAAIERGRQNKALAQERDLSAAVISSLPGVFVHFDESGRIVRCNENLSIVTGLSKEQLHGRDAFSLIADADRKRAQAKLADVFEKGHVEVEFGVLTKGGNVREFHWSARIITRDAQPNVLAVGIDMTEARAAEMKLREAQAALVEAQAVAHMGNFTIDLLNNHTTWSDELFRILASMPRPFAPSFDAYLARVHPDDRDAYRSAHKRSIRQHSPAVLDQRIVRGDGAVRFVQQRWQHDYGIDGKPLRTIGTIQDITEQKAAENTAIQERNLSTALIDTLPGLFILFDERGRIGRSNDNLSEMTGITKEQLQGSDAFAFIVESDHEWAKMKLQEALKLGMGEIEFGINSKANGVRIVHWNGRHVVNDGHSGFVAVGFDMTDARKAESQLRASEERFRTVSHTAQDAIIIIDGAAKVSYWNPAAERILGYTESEAIGRNIHEWLTPLRFREKAIAGMKEFAATGRGAVLGKTLELAAIRKDGTEIPIELSIAACARGRIGTPSR